jgi:DNA repair exonuclease SbcCD ATPase subunit
MNSMRTRSFRLLAGAALAAVVLFAAGCGGGGSDTTASTAAGGTSAEQWATGVCSSFTTWQKSLQSIQASVTSQPSAAALQKAFRQVESATQTLAQSLKQLGKPETAQGQAAKKNLDALANALQAGMSQLKATLDNAPSGAAGTLSQITAITKTLTNMANKLKLAGGNLKNFAPSGELEQAFRQAAACKPYVHS